jgi:hypothetical protein
MASLRKISLMLEIKSLPHMKFRACLVLQPASSLLSSSLIGLDVTSGDVLRQPAAKRGTADDGPSLPTPFLAVLRL